MKLAAMLATMFVRTCCAGCFARERLTALPMRHTKDCYGSVRGAVSDSHRLLPLPRDWLPVCVLARRGYRGARPLSPGRQGTRASLVIDSL